MVCLLGVDDGVFPRRVRPDGDDILAASEWVGDRDPRSEDRQLLLDAIMAAEDHLLVIYAGADPRTGAERPPAVPIGELLDALDATVRTVDGRRCRDHADRPAPAAALRPGQLRAAAPGPGAAASASTPPRCAGPSRRAPPAASASRTGRACCRRRTLGEVITLAELSRFFGHPPRALLRSRGRAQHGFTDDERRPGRAAGRRWTVCEQWAVGDRLLRLHLQGVGLDQLEGAEWRRGDAAAARLR